MSNAQRPTLEKKHTRKSDKALDDELDSGLRLTIDGKVYEARLGDVTPEINRELRRNMGMGFFDLMTATATSPDNDLVSAFVWVARRIDGEFVPFEDVAVTYAQILSPGFDIELPGTPPKTDADPEV